MSEEVQQPEEQLPDENIQTGEINEHPLDEKETGNITEVKNMEVHHHPQLHHKPKPWKEYFLEYLMIVLAVTTGFFAESLREHIADNLKEKEYMVSMLSDLEKDTAFYHRSVGTNNLLITGRDSAINYLASYLSNPDTAKLGLIYFYKYCVNVNFFHSSDGTITQLKNNGGLRLIKNKVVLTKLNIYYRDNLSLQSLEETIKDFSNTSSKQAGEIFNYITNKNLIISANLSKTNNYNIPQSEWQKWSISGGPIMLTTEAKDLSPFLNNLTSTMGLMGTYIDKMEIQKQAATDLILAIKENYSLKNE